ncbi:hypothetical protein HPB50_017295 [Hyalomma asiaticum]|uniref:Uncharacterized protein n=1 Tax=Hyalomma asiaticum TaxID=266040 RepID=A0ACB7RLE0_HYAAI|nr:hypothetical protein HPB50_017295 [Hyalomma asiaticum]
MARVQRELQKPLSDIFRVFDPKHKGLYSSLPCTNGSTPALYGVPKIHKADLPMLDFTRSPLQKLSAYYLHKNRRSDECAFQSEVPGTNLLTILMGPPRKHPSIWRQRLLLTDCSCQATFAPPLYGPGAAERLLFVPSMRPARTDIPSYAAALGLISAPSVDGHLRRSREKKRCLLTVNAEGAELQSWGPA